MGAHWIVAWLRDHSRSTIFSIYVIGVFLMITFNWRCYPGTFIGLFGWAAIWPLYVPAMLVRLVIWGGGIRWETVCMM